MFSTKYSGKRLLIRTLEEVVKGTGVQYREGSMGIMSVISRI
ncbi:hypothetical protein JCM19237_1296 [Photobacterium aphoticum]|uniref:Uncharacterized protein n=1 Tax=Photobacterium aphoticum TaxID=754436 RepID=A0A090QS17_9GAMM|nr:hypothetical protein JCM19237_1296 [Photobacterium aphoticum]